MKVDYLIIGTGLTGAVIARLLVDAGREVLVVDRRNHLGGNVHDHVHPSGIRVHTYGPHYFRTSCEKVWEFVTRFDTFYKYEAALLSIVDGEHVQWPISGSYIKRKVGLEWKPEFTGRPQNFEESALSIMPRLIYEKFVKEYNEKQWGVHAHFLDTELCTRFDVRYDDEPRLKPSAKYQGIPKSGYSNWTANIMDKIPVILNYDYMKRANDISAKICMVFTGPIDEFFGYDLGRLKYRGQKRLDTYHSGVSGFLQPCGQVNNPAHSGGPHIRTLEWKHMMPSDLVRCITGTVLTMEIPFTPIDPCEFEYPFPDSANKSLYCNYRKRADCLEKTVICGRLGEYRYYDMDQAIARAMALANHILESKTS